MLSNSAPHSYHVVNPEFKARLFDSESGLLTFYYVYLMVCKYYHHDALNTCKLKRKISEDKKYFPKMCQVSLHVYIMKLYSGTTKYATDF